VAEIATAYLSILPTMRGTGKAIAKEMDGPDVRRGAEQGGKSAGRRMGGAFRAAAGPLLAAASVAGNASFANSAVSSFSELEDSTAAAGVVFGKSMDKIIAQSETASSRMGMSKQQVVDAANTFGTYGKAAGLSGDALAKFATDQTQLAADMASFKGTSPEEAIEAIGSALRGETEPIRKYGVLLDDAALRNEALKLGLIDSTKEALTPQQKALAAQAAIMKQTGDAQGDFARTSESTANVQKTLQANTENLRAEIGEKLAPAFTAAREVANDFLARISTGIDWIESTGIPAIKSFGEWIVRNKDWLTLLASVVGGITIALGVYRGVVAAVTTATKLMAIAQRILNTVMRANPIGIVITAIGALIGALVWLYNNNETVRKAVDAAWKFIKAGIKAVVDWFRNTAWPVLKTIFEAIGDVVGWLYNNVVKPYFEGWKTIIGGVVNWLRDTAWPAIKRGVEGVQTAFENVRDGIKKAWDALKEIAARPINFILGTVYNDGIAHWWNTIAKAVGLTSLKLPAASLVQFANGTEDHRAQIARGGSMRLWAEPETGGEAYIPLASSKRARSTAILGEVARRFGYGLTTYADGGFWDKVGGTWSRAWRGAASVGGDVWDNARRLGGDIWDFVQDPAGTVTKGLGSLVNRLLGGAPAGNLSRMVGTLPTEFVGGLANAVKAAFTGGVPGAMGTGSARGVAAMTQAISALDPSARVTSGYRPGAVTATGVPSYHGLGRAIDIVSGNMGRTWDLLRSRYGANSAELFYTPKGFLRFGKMGDAAAITRQTHYSHVHWAMANGGILPKIYDQGGWMPPGGVGLNLSTRPEAVLTPDESAALKAGLGSGPLVGQMVVRDEHTAVRELEGLRRRAMTQARLEVRR
jgi:hypothetical protein